jgi:DNA-binding transcriptional regulator LsrR (DeoR family)
MKAAMTRSELLMAVSRLFYQEESSKTAIAHKIGVSVTQVGRLLDEARAEGVVHIRITPPRHPVLQADLLRKFPCLKEAVVVGTEKDYSVQTRSLAQSAADYFDERVRKGTKVGLSGGMTIFEMVKLLPERERKVKLFPTAILGRGHTIVNHIDPIVSLTLLWAKSGFMEDGVFYVTITPLEMQNEPLTRERIRGEIDELLRRKKVSWVNDQMRNLDCVFASLRQIDAPAKQRKQMGASAIDLLSDVGITARELSEEGVIGDINYSFIDGAGKTRQDWRLFLSLQADDLRQMASHSAKRVVVIAGSHKETILRAALAGALLNVLITDERTAEVLLAS